MKVFRSTLILITNISILISLCLSHAYGQHDSSPPRLSAYKRYIVKNVELNGVRSFPQSEIRNLLLTKPNHWYNILKKRKLSKSNVATDVAFIRRFYGRRGFLFAAVRDFITIDDRDRARVSFRVDEGIRTNLSGIRVEGGLANINQKLNKTLRQFKIGEPVNAIRVLSARFALRDLYYDNGYPYARVSDRFEFSIDSLEATVIYTVAESVYTVNGETSIGKIGTIKPDVTLRELVIESGKPYSRRDIIDSEQRLYSTGLYKLLSLRRYDSSLDIRNDTCRVGFILNYEERKPFFINGGVGVGREENFETVFRGALQWGHRNIGGTGRKVIISVRPRFQITDPTGPLKSLGISDLKRKLAFKPIRTTFELNYVEPWFLKQRIPASVNLSYEPNTLNPILEYRYDRTSGEIMFSYELNRFTTARISGATEYVNIRNVPADQQEAFREEGDNQIRRKITFYGEKDTKDNFFVPQGGSYSFIGVDYVGGILGGDFNYLKAQFSWGRYQIITGQNILASRVWVGWLDDMGKKGRSSAEDRFFLGGATTIRGYTENSLGPIFTEADDPGDKLGKPKGGRYLILGNLEIRRPLFWRFGGSAFVDAGNTYTRFEEITPISVAFTSGLGLQFFTPVGPVRFDYGVRLKKDFDLGAGNYHLSILYAF